MAPISSVADDTDNPRFCGTRSFVVEKGKIVHWGSRDLIHTLSGQKLETGDGPREYDL